MTPTTPPHDDVDPAKVQAARERLAELLAKASPGPWEFDYEPPSRGFDTYEPGYVRGVLSPEGHVLRFDDDYGTDQGANARFIAAAHELVPVLLAALAARDEASEALRALEAGYARALDALLKVTDMCDFYTASKKNSLLVVEKEYLAAARAVLAHASRPVPAESLALAVQAAGRETVTQEEAEG